MIPSDASPFHSAQAGDGEPLDPTWASYEASGSDLFSNHRLRRPGGRSMAICALKKLRKLLRRLCAIGASFASHKSFGSASVATTTSQMIQRCVFSLQDSPGAPTKHLSCGTSFLHAGFLEIQSFTKLAHHLSDSRTAWHNEWQAWAKKIDFADLETGCGP